MRLPRSGAFVGACRIWGGDRPRTGSVGAALSAEAQDRTGM